MSEFGSVYAKYYDLLYKDKDYEAEVEYVDSLIKRYNPNAKNILDLGCGTGRHAELLCRKGYHVHGVDASEDMIQIAKGRQCQGSGSLKFTHSKIQDLNLSERFDVIVALFHVLSYQTTNEDVLTFFKVASNHLEDDGILIFDFWYGPAVLTEKPSIRLKRASNNTLQVLRIAEPEIKFDKNLVEVNYTIIISDLVSKTFLETHEKHHMRFFFDTELEIFCMLNNLEIVNRFKWMSYDMPSEFSWSVVWILKK